MHSLEYLEKRLAQIQYATFVARGYSLGSGSVESANKVVVEPQPKGAGMCWARGHLNPLVALRTVACSDRWDEAWPLITAQWPAQVRTRRRERAIARPQAAAAVAPRVEPPTGHGRIRPSAGAGRRGAGGPAARAPWSAPSGCGSSLASRTHRAGPLCRLTPAETWRGPPGDNRVRE
jgi:hypothetical protein